MHVFWGAEFLKVHDLLWVLGFMQEKIQIQTGIGLKAKESVREAVWHKEDCSAGEQPLCGGIYSFYSGYLINGYGIQ